MAGFLDNTMNLLVLVGQTGEEALLISRGDRFICEPVEIGLEVHNDVLSRGRSAKVRFAVLPDICRRLVGEKIQQHGFQMLFRQRLTMFPPGASPTNTRTGEYARDSHS